MKKVGILGGMSYASSLHYYERINQQVNARLGRLHCAEMLLYNVNFQVLREHMLKNEWDKIASILTEDAKCLEKAGADFLVIATNTMHKIASSIEKNIQIPLLHIGDCVASSCKKAHISKVGLLGTRFTMEENFMKDKLKENGIIAVVPRSLEEICEVDRIIFDELCKEQIKESSKAYYIQVIEKMIKEEQIEGVILGCTEIEMLIKPEDLSIPVFDTTKAHIDSIVEKVVE